VTNRCFTSRKKSCLCNSIYFKCSLLFNL